MKKSAFAALTLLFAVVFVVQALQRSSGSPCDLGVTMNAAFSKGAALDAVMKRYAPTPLPGVAMAVYSEAEGWWTGAQGYADVENGIPMTPCHRQFLQSVSKTYLATAILQMRDQGKIDLDAFLTQYLPARASLSIKNAEKITVRMLLNHRSGVPDYVANPGFVSQVLQHPLEYFSQTDCLRHIEGEDPSFEPGSRYAYANTNYLLLSLIGDAVAVDHAAFIVKHILEPLGLGNTHYALNHDYLKGLDLPQSYWDVLNIGRPANISGLQRVSVASSKGDDGIVATPVDAVKFLKGLMEGRLLSPLSMGEMLDFVKDEKGNKRYGMGLSYLDLGGLPAYGHGGGGIGAGCALVHIPSHKIYLFIATNLGVLVEGELSKKADAMKTEILTCLLQ
jgi:D-alanyl-D-alanine carboxypeptidase